MELSSYVSSISVQAILLDKKILSNLSQGIKWIIKWEHLLVTFTPKACCIPMFT